jgi:hypothetical protein
MVTPWKLARGERVKIPDTAQAAKFAQGIDDDVRRYVRLASPESHEEPLLTFDETSSAIEEPATFERIAESMSGAGLISDVTPDAIAVLQRAIKLTADKMPSSAVDTQTGLRFYQPGEFASAEFLDYASVSLHGPRVAVDCLLSGTLSSAMADALAECWPETYAIVLGAMSEGFVSQRVASREWDLLPWQGYQVSTLTRSLDAPPDLLASLQSAFGGGQKDADNGAVMAETQMQRVSLM